MFDKLVESSKETNNDNRKRKIFAAASATVVAAAAAVMLISLFDQALGVTGEFDSLVRLATPMFTESPEPEDRVSNRHKQAPSSEEVATRKKAVARIDGPVTKPPSKVSSDPYKGLTMPNTPFAVSKRDSDPFRANSGRNKGNPDLTGSLADPPNETTEAKKHADPEIKPPPALTKETPKYVGPVNGRAVNLPKPAYPPAARQLGIKGTVKIEVLIDKDGRVLDAKAVDGNALLRGVSVEAAKRSSFSPTTIGDRPVQVRGIIVYVFQ